MERRVGQHQAEPGGRRGDRGCHRRVRPPVHEHDRPLAGGEESGLVVAELPKQLGRVRHQRERLVLAQLARAQAGNRLLVRGIAGEVVAAEPLHGENRAAAQKLGCALDRQCHLWAADRTRDRLGMEASVSGILVLEPAVGAE